MADQAHVSDRNDCGHISHKKVAFYGGRRGKFMLRGNTQYYLRLINITFGSFMALSVHSWHSTQLSAHEGVLAGAPSWAES